jgi:NADH-quinone oxidoreductase subunit M
VLAWSHADVTGGRWSFDLFDLLETPPIGKYQSAAFYLLFYGLAVRTPLFPLHGWLPNMAQLRPDRRRPGAAARRQGRHLRHGALRAAADRRSGDDLAALCRRLRHGRRLLHRGAGLPQVNLRRLLAFAVVSHTSLIVIGLFTLHPKRASAGRAAAGGQLRPGGDLMLLMVGFVYRRTGTTDSIGSAACSSAFPSSPSPS